ncbi:MAG TPA: DinB family protein [Gemmatimonadales bacterium]|nr:DinB family protein [Gemmatimonadales bacterium]
MTAYAASARINQYLVEQLSPAIWRVPPPGGNGRGRTIAALFAHIHNCGLRYLERTDPKGVPGELERARVTPTEAARALGAKGQAVLRIVGAALSDGSRIVGYPHSAVHYLTYYMIHDAHHRGQIVQLARELGHPISQRTMIGMWQWARRAEELRG